MPSRASATSASYCHLHCHFTYFQKHRTRISLDPSSLNRWRPHGDSNRIDPNSRKLSTSLLCVVFQCLAARRKMPEVQCEHSKNRLFGKSGSNFRQGAPAAICCRFLVGLHPMVRSEEHTSEL